ncbi:hydrolase [Thermodesulfobacteriota bacterium]
MMKMNALPRYDMSDNPTDCCPRFKPEGWDGQELHFNDKLFLKAKTRSLFHIPLNMGSVFPKTFAAITDADARNDDDFIVLSYDPSPWTGEHYFSVTREVPGQEMVKLSGEYLTKVFEGPYKNAPKWEKEMAEYVADKGKQVVKTYFFYTTCPKCAKVYGKNYLVAVSETREVKGETGRMKG